MYLPPHFRDDHIDVQHALIRAHPLGLLVTDGPHGLMANPVPFVLDAAAPAPGVLRAHLARANPQLAELAAVDDCLVVFQGPDHYISPSWYPTKHDTGKAVPTWNYTAVHAWGRPQVMDDTAWLRTQVEALTQMQESQRSDPWQVADAPADFLAAQLKGIVGVEIVLTRTEGKFKVSQNRPEQDRAGVVRALANGNDAARAMAALVRERGGIKD